MSEAGYRIRHRSNRERDIIFHTEEVRERIAKCWGSVGRYIFHRRLVQELGADLEIEIRERLARRLRIAA